MIDLLLYLLFMDVPGLDFCGGLTIFIVSISSVCPWVAAIKMINDLVGLSHKIRGVKAETGTCNCNGEWG